MNEFIDKVLTQYRYLGQHPELHIDDMQLEDLLASALDAIKEGPEAMISLLESKTFTGVIS